MLREQWTDTGQIHEERDLKGRAGGETRSAPGHPAPTRILRQHVERQPPDLKRRLEAAGDLPERPDPG
ncbi:hypothetical protein [Streptomyces sp. NPDC127066]|uniref:hypothetical protein n=1 Tax=Streptomyces sp. NPDC127066 TaxID=3347125 RepID=UPI003667715C